MEPIYINEDMNVVWFGATGRVTATGATIFLNSATVTYALKNAAGTVTLGTGTVPYIAASNGDYLGVIESEVTALLTRGAAYLVEVTLVQAPYNGFRSDPYRATVRSGKV